MARRTELVEMIHAAARIHEDVWPTVQQFFVRGIRNVLFSYTGEDRNNPVTDSAAVRINDAIARVRAQQPEHRHDFCVGEVEKMVADVARSRRKKGA